MIDVEVIDEDDDDDSAKKCYFTFQAELPQFSDVLRVMQS